MIRYYILNKNRRWQRAHRCGYDSFVLADSPNVIRKFEHYEVKEIIK